MTMAGDNNVRTRLADGNALFRKSMSPGLLRKVSGGQGPSVAILSCSDSRVTPEKVFNLSIGDAFVVRVAGNSASDPSVLGSIEYAVEHLRVRALVVLGHTDCGAVKAIMDGEDMGNLTTVRRDIERSRARLETDRMNDRDAISESNVRLQLRLIEDSSRSVRDAVSLEKLELIGAMYDLQTGAVRFL